METTTDLAALLPADVLADVLRRLPPRGIVTSRCVCKAWRALVDAHPLLRAALLPRSLAGILINFNNLRITEFFSRPSTGEDSSSISGDSYARSSWCGIQDHCNGLLYNDYSNFVLNPATRWRAFLPPKLPPRLGTDDYHSIQAGHLVYDPAVSLHYEVFLVPHFMWRIDPDNYDDDRESSWSEIKYDPVIEQSEWPPSPCVLHVFSSKVQKWEERSFIREGKAAGTTIADMRLQWPEKRNAVYWRGVLYVHCQTNFVMRISLSRNKYQVIEPPISFLEDEYFDFCLGKSEKGVYCASPRGRSKFKVWFLDESCHRVGWVLKYDVDLIGWLLKNNLDYQRQNHGPWTLQDINYHYDKYRYQEDENIEVPAQENSEWDSEDEKTEFNFGGANTDAENNYCGYIDILGFHPYKEIIFLSERIRRGLAYHLKSSKVQDLGCIYPTRYEYQLPNEQGIEQSFPYTPCWTMGPSIEEKET